MQPSAHCDRRLKNRPPLNVSLPHTHYQKRLLSKVGSWANSNPKCTRGPIGGSLVSGVEPASVRENAQFPEQQKILLDRLVEARAADSLANYNTALEGTADLGERVTRLAEARTREGYMAEARRDGKGFLLVENHCPICAAATACQGFCRAERDVFEKALGPGVSVERNEHIVGGDRRCAYRIALECVADSPTSPKRKKSP